MAIRLSETMEIDYKITRIDTGYLITIFLQGSSIIGRSVLHWAECETEEDCKAELAKWCRRMKREIKAYETV